MSRRQEPAPRRSQAPAYREAFARLDRALEQNTPSDNVNKIRLLRLALFGDVDRLQASGTVKLPE
jgi:hypothetical protein